MHLITILFSAVRHQLICPHRTQLRLDTFQLSFLFANLCLVALALASRFGQSSFHLVLCFEYDLENIENFKSQKTFVKLVKQILSTPQPIRNLLTESRFKLILQIATCTLVGTLLLDQCQLIVEAYLVELHKQSAQLVVLLTTRVFYCRQL